MILLTVEPTGIKFRMPMFSNDSLISCSLSMNFTKSY